MGVTPHKVAQPLPGMELQEKEEKNKKVCRKVDRKCPLILDLKPFGPKVKREAF